MMQAAPGKRRPGFQSKSRCCALFASGSCPFPAGVPCPRGSHEEPGAPSEQQVFRAVTQAKRKLIQQKWAEAGGSGVLAGVWQVHNPMLEFLFRGAEASF